MDPNDQTPVVADETLSPSVTEEGAAPSAAADSPAESLADALARELAGDAPEEEAAPEPEPAPAAEAAKAEPAQAPVEADDSDDDKFRIPEAEFKALPDGVKKRIGHLNAQFKKAERELGEVQKDLPTLRDAHERFTKISAFVQEHQIEPENVTLAFNAMALMAKGDYQGFLKAVKPWVDMAAQAAGEAISPDLQEKLEAGYITEEAARELTQARIAAQTAKAQAERSQRVVQDRQAADNAGAEIQRISAAVTAREQELMATDPDYARKKPLIEAAVRLAVKNGAPRTAQAAVAILDEAYALSKVTAPAAPPRQTAPRPTATSPGRGHPEPKTLNEALLLSLEATTPR